MSRLVEQQRNTWGSQGDTDNPQRTDLWVVDLWAVVAGLNQQIKENPAYGMELLPELPTHFAQTISLPELKVAAAEYKRDSVPFQMPAQDEATGQTRIVFVMDSPGNSQRSKIYQVLDTWKTFVRAGRTTFGGENAIPLNKYYTVDHAFDVTVMLLRGASQPIITQISNGISDDYFRQMERFSGGLQYLPPDQRQARVQAVLASVAATETAGVVNDLEVCGFYLLQNAWLSSFKVSELTYTTGNTFATIEATLFSDYLLDQAAHVPGVPPVYT